MSTTSKKSSSSSSSRTPTKRILTELSAYTASPPALIPALSPSPSNILNLRAILSGASLPSTSPYRTGRWLLSIAVPATYPNAAPTLTFVTRICHPNVKFETGEICLDVLKENWTPILGVVGCLEAVGRLLEEPGVDSPLNLDVAALERNGDWVGARGLVGFWCGEERWEGGLEEGEVEGRR